MLLSLELLEISLGRVPNQFPVVPMHGQQVFILDELGFLNLLRVEELEIRAVVAGSHLAAPAEKVPTSREVTFAAIDQGTPITGVIAS